MNRVFVALGVWVLGSSIAIAEPFKLESGKTSPQLIELYTSEGCSSCPPADRWLSKFVDDPGLWTEFLPVAFHVDYWDRLGWKDRFGSRENTLRRYRLRDEGAVKSIYTPGFVVDGREWRGWFQGDRLGRAGSGSFEGSLVVEVDSGEIRVSQTGIARGSLLNVAILGAGLDTQVARGENKGRRLAHDFVALEHLELPLRGQSTRFDIPEMDTSGANRLALAVWVVNPGESEPIVAMGGWLPSQEAGYLSSNP